MSRIVSVVNQKGGVGKTTAVVNLAAVLSEANHRLLVLDVDPQKSSTYWGEVGEERLPFDYTSSDDPELLRKLRLADGYDTILVDTPGSLQDEKVLDAVLDVTDYAVIPVEVSALTIRSTLTTIGRLIRPRGLRHRALINKVDPRTAKADAQEIKEFLDAQSIPYFQNVIRAYKIHARAPLMGIAVTQYGPDRSSRNAREDFQRVGMEMLNDWARQDPAGDV